MERVKGIEPSYQVCFAIEAKVGFRLVGQKCAFSLRDCFNPNSEIKTAGRHPSLGHKRLGTLASQAAAKQLPI